MVKLLKNAKNAMQKYVQNPAYSSGTKRAPVARYGCSFRQKRPLVDMRAAEFVVQFSALPNAEEGDFGDSAWIRKKSLSDQRRK